MIPRTIYLETPLWNELCAQRIDADDLLNELYQRGACVVMSTQLMCELAAAFQSKRSENPNLLGSRLFAYLSEFVSRGIPCLKMNCQLLRDEAMTITGEINSFNAILPGPDYVRMAQEVEKLSNGTFDADAQDFLLSRRNLLRESRIDAAEYVNERPELKERCANITFEEYVRLAHPIDQLRVLRGHLDEEFPETDPQSLTEVAVALLRNPSYRVAHTMILADSYVTWRTARAGSLSRDVLDDCYHLVNASYCNVYATKDRPQAEYAPLVVRPTEVRFYDGSTPLSDWLLRVALE